MNLPISNTGMDISLLTNPPDMRQKVGLAFDDEGHPKVGFVIRDKDSQEFQAADKRLRIAALKVQADKTKRIDTRTETGAQRYFELVESDEIEVALAVTADWFGFVSGGVPTPYDPVVMRQILETRPSWRARILAALEDERAFQPAETVSAAP